MIKGLKVLHDMNINHRDLKVQLLNLCNFVKSANIFISKDHTVKLGDMNVSKLAKKGLLYT